MPRLRRLAVFLASSPGADPAWARLAYDTGRELAERGIGDTGFLRQTAIEDLVVAPSLDEALAGLDAKLPSERELRPGT